MIDNPYKVLGLEEGASDDEIKKAYRQMAKINHPDLHPNDPDAVARMNEINEAYDMLMKKPGSTGSTADYGQGGYASQGG